MATHELVFDGDRVVKRYTSWARGEHRREWAVLNLLHRHVPDLVPEPVSAELDACPPSVTMGVVPGEAPSGPLTAEQFDALEVALRRLWSVPVAGLPPRRYRPREAVDAVVRDFRSMLTGRQPPGTGVVAEAMAAAVTYLGAGEVSEAHADIVGHSDPNLANYLWDTSGARTAGAATAGRFRIVDFEDAGRSDVAYELATLVEHISAYGTDWTGFLGRFGVDPVDLRVGRRLNAALWLRTLLLAGRPGALEAAKLRRQAERVLFLCP